MLGTKLINYLFSQSSGNLPQKLHGSPVLFKCGFWLEQVPANLPSFFAQIFMARPANPSASNPIVINISFMIIYLH